MPEQPRTIYIDACVIMSYLTEDPNRIGVLRNVMDDAARTNRFVLHTSTLSIAEVAFIEAEAVTSLGGDDLKAIEDCWTQGPIRLVEANAIAMRAARDLLRALTTN